MMSSSDLFVEGFPHGTPEGYDDGCRGGACPAGVEYGLSCKIAKAKSRGDYQYQQLVKRGATIPEIADALGFVGTETATPVAQAKSKPKATPATVKGGRAIADDPTPAPEPVEEAATQTPEPPRMNGPRASSSTIATGNASGSSTTEQPAPKPAEFRAWAIAKGYKVGTKGTLPKHIIDHYWEATGRLEVTDVAAAIDSAADVASPLPPAIAEHIAVIETKLTDELIPKEPPTKRPEWGAITESVDVEAARSLAVRLEQELAHVTEERDAAVAEASALAVEVVDAFGAKLQLENLVARLRGERDTARLAAAAGETATRLALRKWAEERANSEASYAVILDQANTINTLTAAGNAIAELQIDRFVDLISLPAPEIPHPHHSRTEQLRQAFHDLFTLRP